MNQKGPGEKTGKVSSHSGRDGLPFSADLKRVYFSFFCSSLCLCGSQSGLADPMKLKRKSSPARDSLFFSVRLSVFAVFNEMMDCMHHTCFAVFFSCVDAANCEAEQSHDNSFGLTNYWRTG
jgi:hypothetical protein